MKHTFLLFCLSLVIIQTTPQSKTMKAHLPRGWYPQDKEELKNRLNFLEKEANNQYPTTLTDPRVLIVPHAGYAYSGIIAASCFNTLQNKINTIDTIIVIAPSHSIPFQGIAIPSNIKEYTITTGIIPFDTKTMHNLIKHSPFISTEKVGHNPFKDEHSFEIECPFIHNYLPNIPVVPLMVGYLNDKDIKNAASILKRYITPQTLIIVSSDFTHYGSQFDYMPFGKTQDALTAIQLLDLTVIQHLMEPSLSRFLRTLKETNGTVCGKYPLALLLALLENNTLGPVKAHLVSYATSQESKNSDPESSVSYAGIVYSNDTSLTHYEKKLLLTYAKNSIIHSFITQKTDPLLPPIVTPAMKQKCGTFVSWYGPQHTLRGCIGTIEASNTLLNNITTYAQAAAFEDPRFEPITLDEALQVTPSITVLTPFKGVTSYKEIKLGIHGILLKNGSKQAVFLPQVPLEQGWNLTTTLEQLSLKAGLSKDDWKNKKTELEVCEGYEIK